jgi:hypothetical protein
MNGPFPGVTKVETAKHVSDPFAMSKYEPNMTGKGVAHANDACTKPKVASEEALDLVASVYASIVNAGTEYNLKIIEIARTNNRAAFVCAHESLGGKPPSELVELSTTHMRRQFDLLFAQNKALCALVQELTAGATEPIKTGMLKTLNKVT